MTKRMYKSTKDQLRFFRKHPEIVARVYALNAHGHTVNALHETINEEIRGFKDFVRMTPTTTRKLLHRLKPFDIPCLFKQIDPIDEDWVKRRHRSTSYDVTRKNTDPPKETRAIRKTSLPIPPLSNTPTPTPSTLEVPLIEKESVDLLLKALNAYVQYQNTLTVLKTKGISKASMDSWCALTIDLFTEGETI